ncbi:hypothetical protein LTR99_007610 [Exophiala xenobiotica]|uniref:Uncharacterized protein n=1 Tax=Vermiconidia calcicola TaxID=1690605 RepID=A0AAV9Q7X6_9PEZI|nr:hypothetical protein LTR92_002387 [Exophiala xenobiotica]KAK5532715.1 hypothetical protein LTR23_009425 [Chaetothyriales sp. CCFEE 6169]KAK5534719.1 hypothetical protein LTR25_006751 [Vermiconidia calcicola]KAK5268884.1 hypothetical protein LTR96_005668 [Exophiala xenobiotica]KAK5299342.1 hypothetical protein LTR99_007610 [Exophiala xenobiotica]
MEDLSKGHKHTVAEQDHGRLSAILIAGDDVQSAKKKKETGKKNNEVKAGRRIKDRVVHAEHEAGIINSSDSDYQSAMKRIESRKSTKRKTAAKIQDEDNNVLREHKDGEIDSSDGDYKAAKRRREGQKIRNARHHDKEGAHKGMIGDLDPEEEQRIENELAANGPWGISATPTSKV